MSSSRLGRGLLVALLGGLLTLLLWSELPLCPMAGLFGIPCPGCGLTRATLAALSGDFALSLRYHPLALLLAPLYLALTGVLLIGYLLGAGPAARRSDRLHRLLLSTGFTRAVGGLLVVVIGVWLARFTGKLGGPVPVETYLEVAQRQARADHAVTR